MSGMIVCEFLGRMASPCHNLGILTLLLVHILGTISALRTGLMDRSSFKFTQDAYNASILENSVGKTYVSPTVKMGIYITDPTVDVKYRLTKGDDSNLFKTEERTVGDFCFLLIRTRSAAHSVINRERREEYKLSIKAIGKHKRSGMSDWQTTTEIYVKVLDANDLSPLFHPISYTAEVPEDTNLHQRIIQVTASDADIGVNGEIYYSFSQETDTFAIHPTSGDVSLTKKLSYIEQNYYELNIIAQDRGPSLGPQKRYSLARLEVRVLEVNFYSPQIEIQGLPAVVEHGKIGTIYGILYVQDKDYGSNGELKVVEIVDGDPHGYFRLDKGDHGGEYTIKVANTLDRELNQYGFNLTIHATDKGNPPRETTKEVHVQLQDTNDNSPGFHQSVYKASIEECVPVHTPLTFVNATDPDYGKNAEIVYTITDGDDNSWFRIDGSSGLITVSSALDAETSTHLTLTVQAQDQANKGSRKVSEAMVHVEVLDCNDNSPVFREPEPVVSIEESLPVGTVVYQVSAFDLDSEDNGYVSYSIANVDSVPFTINDFTGNISTKEVLDYESMRRLYSLVVRASDWGSPYRRESEMILKIQLRDINDNKPQFEKVRCTGYLSREAPINTKLVTVSAIDFDVGNIISYQLVSGNEDGCFEMSSSTGELKTKCDLRSHTGEFLSIMVTATDGLNKADATSVNITFVNNKRDRHLANSDANFNCQDTYVTEELGRLLEKEKENDFLASQNVHIPGNFIYSQNSYAPQFKQNTIKKITIKEGLPRGHKVVTMDADDEDHGYNGRVVFVLTSGNTGGTFSMDTYKGDLEVIGNVDRESVKQYLLNVTVTDMGKPAKSSSIILQVDVEDVNDNPPVFEKPGYAVTISEAVPVNTTVVQVVAHDRDEGGNANVRYSIVTDNNDFAIDSKSGMIRVNKDLDRETIEEYRLKVKATDSASENPLSSTVMVTIKLTDINDNAPRFALDSYVVRVREDMPLHTVIMTISAEDPDSGSGGNVRYTLTHGTDGKFDIDKSTGTVRIIEELDYEQKQIYNITVRARDRGEPSKTSKCQFVVHVVDVNENMHAPRFKDFVFQGRVRENQPRNTSVLQLIASDLDRESSDASPKDYQIIYSIRDGSGMGRFTINNQGIIRTNMVLDRESQSHYWLTVYAQDRGTVPLSSYVEVLIEVEDVNDNIPQTVEPVYYPSVLENSPEGVSVVTLQAYDLDDSDNNQITYHISSGNPQGFFIIDRNTGLIKTSNRKLDREKQEEHILEVTVSDNGVPQLSSTTRVVVNVEDDNDESPKFTEALYRVRIPEMAGSNNDVSLYRVLAYDNDKDANADIDYSIKDGKGNGRFKIHPKTGMIYSQKDFQVDSQFDLTVRAVDNGRPQQKSSVRVRFEVVARPSTSANPPRFVQEGVQAKVMENDQIGTMITLMNAEDGDGDKIWYSITDGNTNDAFTIDTENGNILLARLLDWEDRHLYNLTVKATDSVQDAYTWVQITVLDINDNRPQFELATYEIDIPENTARGTDILTVSAEDKDEDQRLFYTIHSSTDQASRGKFKINSETDKQGSWTGVITMTDSLNREAISSHELTIMVRDQGTPSKRSLARVIINVADHNDNAPEFLGPVFEGRVFETAVVGSSVLQVMAVDRDKGKNAELKYSIVSGNVGSTFSIDGALGIVSLAKTLDRQTQSQYSMVVKAADGGSPSLTSTVPVNIQVTVSNNAPPRFEHEEYTAEIQENQPEGSTVTAVHATSRSSVVYELIDGNQDSSFIINPNSGVISSNVMFDYELRSFYNLTVRGTNMVGAYVSTMLLVHIIDQNDNQPIFNQEKYEGNISEAAQPGSVILDGDNVPLVIKATDLDTNLNSLLTYNIVETDAMDVFEIDSTTGAVKTKISLDHEVAPVYEFTVKVTDKGTPQQTASAPAKVTINIIDLNDSPPVFTQEVYSSTLLLPTYQGVQVLTVIAKDADLAVNSPLEYSIIRGNDHSHFTLDPTTGTVTVTNAGDMLDYYEFAVRVSDGKYQAECAVQVHVDYTQDSGLKFSSQEYYAEIEENSTVAHQVAVVQAVGHALNEHLTFRILNPSPVFTVGETSGVVETTGVPLDREARDNVTVVVEVVDQRSPPRVAHVRVLIHVLDINDNVPVFVNQPYYAIVPVDASRGQTVKRVTAVDRDTGANGEVVYSLVAGGDGKLGVKRDSGDIYLAQQLGLDDQNKEMSLTVRAQDQGTPPLSSEVQVPIVIMNKATPVFDHPYISVSVPEDVPMHTAILTIEATSPTGKKLIYSITDGDIYGEFTVDFNTGSITVIEDLDYEMRKSYDLKVRATDVDTGSSADAIVHIQLEDVNDRMPSFLSLAYTATVSEAVSIGTSVLTVTAEDRDSGLNALVRYRIQNMPDSNDGQFFHIDPEQGVIFTKQRLDHEQTQHLLFTVVATDNGIPALSASVQVSIVVTDLNDNPPKFDRPSYQATVTDQATRGQFVTIVTASDADSSDAGRLAYSIIDGNDGQAFSIEEFTGILSLSSRKPQLLPQYMLNVSVTDGVFTNFARVKITVQGSNRHVPTFSQPIYDVDVIENAQIGKSVAMVTAEDEDLGPYGAVKYYIESEDMDKVYRIDEKTGELFTRMALDRESVALYQVPIKAVDGGGRVGFTTVRVNVADQGDNKPEFEMNEYKANIYSQAETGTSILQVMASDRDIGSNSDLEYSIYETQDDTIASQYFDVDAHLGTVLLKDSVDGLDNQLFQFFLRATDLGSPPMHSEVPVEIYVMGPVDRPPTFEQEQYTYFIPEGRPVGSTIATVKAESNESLSYSIVAGDQGRNNNPVKYGIDEEGKITLLEPLDREETESFELHIKAETKTSPPLVAYTTVIVNIMDINDNTPRFESDPYSVSIAENGAVGSKVVQVIAHDRDTGANADVSYEFASDDSSWSNVFAVDPQTGWITTLIELDREAMDLYSFNIVAKDRGAQVQLSVETTVKITVMDHNDSPPVFSQKAYEGAVNEDALPGTIILMVSSADADLGQNAKVAYHLTEGDRLGQFNVRNSGEVYVNRALDRETKSWYELTVSATDGAYVTTAKVYVTILDANDNSPICGQPMYQQIIAENAQPGSFIVKVSATDLDEKETRNARIEYLLSGDSTDTFNMHQSDGIISTKKTLDRETQAEYQLKVTAMDGGGLYCTSDVYITLSDVNDNPPRFSMSEYTVMIPENAEVNTLLTRVSAVDFDLGINRKVQYAMKDNGNQFKIDEFSGIVSLTEGLDRERKPKYNLTIYAHDQGTPKMTSTAHLVVLLLDINDNPPEFERSVYEHTIPEDIAVGGSILQIYATSRDTGVNAEISYSIVGGNEHGAFTIDPKSGVISLMTGLDYEAVREYMLTVQGNDGGTPSLSNTAIVKINVTDANDNAPVFAQSEYTAEVQENANLFSNVLQVQAKDRDSAPNAMITYTLGGGDELEQFSIDPEDGFISIKSELDRETIDKYSLEVYAVDSGTPSLTGSVVVHLEVQDINDCPPAFNQSNYTAVLQVDDNGKPSGRKFPHYENKELGCTIVRLEVTDADLDPNGPPFSFDIIDGNQEHEFKIDRDGVISTAARFNRQIKDVYLLTARVFDNGSPPLYSDALVEVRIVEESAFPPIVTPLVASITAVDDIFPGGVVGRVKAYDKDAYDNLEFTLTPEDDTLFDVHPLDGTLTATQSLDPGVYHLNVSVSDGKFITTTTVEVNIEGVTSEMTQNAVVIRFQNMLPEEFIGNHLTTFVSLLKSDLAVRPKDIKVLGVQPASDSVITPSKRKRSIDSDLDVLLAVHKAQDKYYRGNALRRKLLQATEAIENRLGTKIMKIFNDVCTKGSCVEGTCETIVHFDNDRVMTIITDKGSHVSAKHTLGYQCNCRPRWGGPYCNQEIDACTPDPCPAPRTCEVDDLNYKCNCPDGLLGEDCDLVSKVDGETPLSFSGHSYSRWQMKLPMERRLSLSLRVKTVQRRARLMHAVGRVDYSILEIEDGYIQYRFDCGSGEGLARVDKIKVSDGIWHDILLERNSRNIRITIDGKFSGEGTAPGTNDVLNLDSNDLFFGAEVALLASGHDDLRQGFVGCMLAIQIDKVELPFSGSNPVAMFKSSKDVEYYCRKTIIPSVCSSSPCFNGGTCIALGKERFTCQCNQPRFTGRYCEFDTNPCESSPCLHGGICEKRENNDYYCKCHSNLNGKRCELNYFCLNNPCKNRGKCRDGDTGPVCECDRGFTGTYCEHDINECEQSPCLNGATCHNLYGGFRCNCTAEVTGDLCEMVNFPTITSNSMGISLEEILGIVGVVFGILVIVIVFILLIRWRRRKRRRENSMLNSSRDSGDLKMKCNDDYKRSHKMNNISSNLITIPPSPRNPNHHVPSPRISPRPPPVPTRPASYTPSAAESMNTLNNCNFDSARNYGSAADDLEVSGTLREPIEIPDFLTNVDVDKYPEPVQRSLPPPPAEEVPLLPNKWDPNFAQNYPDDLKKQSKKMPNGNQSMQSLPLLQSGSEPVGGSIASLQSEPEDDMQAKAALGRPKTGYHWDTSDWNPTAGAPLHSIAEVPLTEIRDSGSNDSNDSNVHLDPGEYEYTDYPDEEYDEGQDSEYVGDSEYAENEFPGDDTDDPDAEYPDPPDFKDILAMQGELDYGDVDRPERRYNLHPDSYLPPFNISQGSQPGEDWADPTHGQELNGNLDPGDEDGVIHYGFPSNSLRQPKFRARPISYAESDYYDQHGGDEMSMSMGGYTSTNASMSDMSEVRLCEIDDSEANNSDDSADENTNLTKPQPCKKSKGKGKDSKTHTQV